jgi:4-nitrophenyl phosphatase
MAVHLDPASSQDYETLLDKYDTWIFDCDGVLWHGDRIIDGVVDVLKFLRQKSEHSLFICSPTANFSGGKKRPLYS